MNLAGIDGCRAGWLAVFHRGGKYSGNIYRTFTDLIADNPDLDRVLIDIPLGLSSPSCPRTIDALLRKELPGRGSTVFNAPCRAAVYEKDADRARELNRTVEGKSLSLQSLYIRDKMRELDEFLSHSTGPEILESHPELCFKYLNGGIVVLSKKSTTVGIAERLDILGRIDISLPALYEAMLKTCNRKDAKKDDLLDAICLCLVNVLGEHRGLSILKDKNIRDEKGIEMKLAYYRI